MKVLPSLPGLYWWKPMFELGGEGQQPLVTSRPCVTFGSVHRRSQSWPPQTQGSSSSVRRPRAGHPETSQLELRTAGSCCDAPVVAGEVDCTSQPGDAWPGARRVLETPPSVGACRSSLQGAGYSSQSWWIPCILNVYLLLRTSAYSLPTRDQYQAYTHLNVLDHPGDQVIKAARRFGRKTVLEITLRCNPRTGFFIEGHSWCQTHVEKKRTGL